MLHVTNADFQKKKKKKIRIAEYKFEVEKNENMCDLQLNVRTHKRTIEHMQFN
jgi:hypothetical protein